MKLGPGLEDRGARCEQPEAAATQKPGRRWPEVRDWGQAAALARWELDEMCSGPGPVGRRQLGWNEGPQPGCAADAESAGSAADGPSSLHISAAPCGTTDGQPAAADAGIPTAHTQTQTMLKFL